MTRSEKIVALTLALSIGSMCITAYTYGLNSGLATVTYWQDLYNAEAERTRACRESKP